jgi:DNA-binding transcriptional LysR family regulator
MTDRRFSALGTLDLRQLLALEALVGERSVTAAARRLGMSQPAMSRALAQLRQALGDRLLVAGRKGLVPTDRAVAIAADVARALRELEQTVRRQGPLEPATLRRTFAVAAVDLCAAVVLPRVEPQLLARAPGVKIELLPGPEATPEAFERGAVDLAITVVSTGDPGLRRASLYEDRLVCAVRRGHPGVRDGRLDLEAYVRHPHVLVTPERRSGRGLMDELLAARGLGREVVVRVPSFFVAPFLLPGTDLILTAPRSALEPLLPAVPIELLPLPLPAPPFTVSLVWHERSQEDPAHRWLRALVAESCRELRRARRRGG